MVGGFFEVEYQFKLRDMFSKEADKIIAKFDKVRDAATRANTRFVELSKNVKTSSDNLKQLSNGIKPVNQGLQTMNQSAKAVTASVRAQNQALAAQSRALKVARASMVDYNRMAGVMMQAGQGLFRTGNMLGLTVTAPIVAAAFAGGKKFIGREERATQVRKTTGLSKVNADYLIKLANKYSGRNPTSTEEMLDIAGILGAAGFGSDSKAGTQELMTKATTVAKMMSAFDMSSEQAGSTYAKMYQNTKALMNKNKDSKLYGKFSDQYFNRFLDFVDLLEDQSPVKASEIFEAMKTRTLASGLMIPGGMDPYETAAITTQLLQFKSPSRASNIISTLFKSFADPTKVGEKMSKQFRDTPFETLVGFFDVMKGSKTDKAYDMAMAVNSSYSGELTAISAFEKQIRSFAKEANELKALAEQERISGNIQQGGLLYGNTRYGLDRSYQLKVDTFLGKLTVLKNNVDNALANFFTRIEPTISRFIERITPKVRAFAEAIETMPEKQLWVIISALTGLALLAPSLMIVGTLLNSISAIMKAISTVQSGVFITIYKEFETFIFKMLGLGSLLGVTTGAGATVVGGGVGVSALGYTGSAIAKAGTPAAKQANAKIMSMLSLASVAPKQGFFGKMFSKIGGFNPFKGGKLPGGLGVIGDLFGDVGRGAGGMLSKIGGSQFLKTAGTIGKSFAPVSIISSILEGAITGKWMESLLGGGGGWLGGALGGAAMGTLGGGPIGTILGMLGGGFMGTEMGKGLGKSITSLFPNIDGTFIESLKSIINLFKALWQLVLNIIQPVQFLFEDMVNGIKNTISSSPAMMSFLHGMRDAINATYEALKKANEEFGKWLDLQERERAEKRMVQNVKIEGEQDNRDRTNSPNRGLMNGVTTAPAKLEIKIGPDGTPRGVVHNGKSTVVRDKGATPLTIPIYTPLVGLQP